MVQAAWPARGALRRLARQSDAPVLKRMDIVIVVQAQTLQPGSLTFGNPLPRIAVREVGVSGAVLLVQILVFGELVVFQVRRPRPRLETVQGPFLAGGRRQQMTALDPKPPVAFVQYMSADGKTFYLFSSGGDCLSVARGRLP